MTQTHYASVPAATSGLRVAIWSGRILSGLVIAFMLFDSAIKFPPLAVVTETMGQLGFYATPELARGLGILGLLCTLLYAWPRTAVIGAILLTGFSAGRWQRICAPAARCSAICCSASTSD